VSARPCRVGVATLTIQKALSFQRLQGRFLGALGPAVIPDSLVPPLIGTVSLYHFLGHVVPAVDLHRLSFGMSYCHSIDFALI
jgi:hypothetical protein